MKKKTSAVPAWQRELEDLRARIDGVDHHILTLLNDRARLAVRIGKLKARVGRRAYAPERERALLDRLVAANRGPLGEESLRLIYKEVVSASLALESPLHVAYLGPEAAFTHEAAKRHFGLSARLAPRASVAQVFEDVERRRCDYGVVPIENSLEGMVGQTLDALGSTELSIEAEVLLQVSHSLLAATADPAVIRTVVATPQALEQCAAWLERHLPSAVQVPVASTTRAAQLAAEASGTAVVASELAAGLYGLQLVAAHIEDARENLTRFLILGREGVAPTGTDRTSVMFALKDAPGILYRALAPFAELDINLSRMESRPSRQRAWDYMFFIDLEGHISDVRVAEALTRLREACAFIKVLGSYPRGHLLPTEGRTRTA